MQKHITRYPIFSSGHILSFCERPALPAFARGNIQLATNDNHSLV